MSRSRVLVFTICSLLLSIVMFVTVFAQQGPPEKRTVHKVTGSGECKENRIPVQAPANGWEEGSCPSQEEEPTNTPVPVESTNTPVPVESTSTPVPVEATEAPEEAEATKVPGAQPTVQVYPTATATSFAIQALPTGEACVVSSCVAECCELDPSEVALNEAKVSLLDALTGWILGERDLVIGFDNK